MINFANILCKLECLRSYASSMDASLLCEQRILQELQLLNCPRACLQRAFCINFGLNHGVSLSHKDRTNVKSTSDICERLNLSHKYNLFSQTGKVQTQRIGQISHSTTVTNTANQFLLAHVCLSILLSSFLLVPCPAPCMKYFLRQPSLEASMYATSARAVEVPSYTSFKMLLRTSVQRTLRDGSLTPDT